MAAPICHGARMENPSPAQLRAACSLLDIGYGELASSANVSVSTVKRAMGKGKAGPISQRSMSAIVNILDNAGIRFIEGGVATCDASPNDAYMEAMREVNREEREIAEIAKKWLDQLN